MSTFDLSALTSAEKIALKDEIVIMQQDKQTERNLANKALVQMRKNYTNLSYKYAEITRALANPEELGRLGISYHEKKVEQFKLEPKVAQTNPAAQLQKHLAIQSLEQEITALTALLSQLP